MAEQWVTLAVAILTLSTAIVNHVQVRTVKRDVGSRMSQLLRVSIRESHAAGVQEQKDLSNSP